MSSEKGAKLWEVIQYIENLGEGEGTAKEDFLNTLLSASESFASSMNLQEGKRNEGLILYGLQAGKEDSILIASSDITKLNVCEGAVVSLVGSMVEDGFLTKETASEMMVLFAEGILSYIRKSAESNDTDTYIRSVYSSYTHGILTEKDLLED